MKIIVLATAFFVLMAPNARAQPAPAAESAETIMKSAFKTAAKEKKNVLVMFHASWCGWCHRMDTSLNDPACKKFFDDNFVIRHLVVDESKDKKQLENPGADDMRRQYHGEGQGIPFWLIFDKDGKLLADSKIHKEGEVPEGGQNIGCPATAEEVNYFIELLKKTSKLSPEQEEKIRIRFRKNEG